MNRSIEDLKHDICEVGRRIWQSGFCAGNEGNHSVRVDDDRVLCTPTGMSKGFLDPEDVIVVDMDGAQVEPNARGRRPTSEFKMHAALYRHRDDIRAVVHSHPPHCTAFTCASIDLPEGIHPEAEIFLGRVPMARYATPSTADLPASIIENVESDTNTVLLQNHGAVCFSTDLTDALYKLEVLESYCRLLLLTKQLGRVNVLDDAQMTALLEVKDSYFKRPDRRRGVLDGAALSQRNQASLDTMQTGV